jgi:L-iditol 2-dehydrogenase
MTVGNNGNSTMAALLFTAISEQQLVEVAVPEIERPGDVLLRVKSVGVCGSDLHGYTGHSGRRTPPLIMGHEVTGEVVAIGREVEDLQVGSRVAVQPVSFCGYCSQCVAGRRSICENRLVMGMTAQGAYAEYVTWPADNLYELPNALSYEAGALTEPLSVAVHAVGLAHIRPYDTAFVVGAGPIGLLTVAVLRLTGLKQIAVSDVSDRRLEVARTLGAHLTVNPSKQDLDAVIKENTDGQGVDVAFEAVGLGATAQQTLQATRNKGTVVWIGNNARMIEIDMQAVVTRELSVLGSYGMSEEEFQRSILMLADGSVPAAKLISRRAVLAEGPGLFDELLASPETIKCVINF